MGATPTVFTSDASVAAPRRAWLGLALYSSAHFFIDLYSGALSAYQPHLVAKHGMSLAQAGLLGGVLVFSSSVTQPAYGYLSDRFRSRLFSALAPAVAGVFIAALGMASSFGMLLALVLLGGAGISSFHPQASARATLGVVENRARWMAVFISSGTLGLAIGPAYFSALIDWLGLPASLWGAVPGVLMTLLLLTLLPEPADSQVPRSKRFDIAPLRKVWRPLTILYFLVFIRSILQITFAQFLPLYLHRERGFSTTDASLALTLYLAAGAIGGFIGGHLADRFGGRAVIFASMVLCVPFLAVFFLASGPLALTGVALGGLTLLFTIPVNVTMAQELAPEASGTVSALMMGFAWGMAGMIFIPLTGWVADRLSLHAALSALLVFPLAGAYLTTRLRKA